MIEGKVDTYNLGKLLARARKASMDKIIKVNEEMGYAAYEMEEKAVEKVPVHRSGLKQSIAVEKRQFLLWFLKAVKVYAAYIEYGTPTGTGPHGGPKPYMRPAFYEVMPKLMKNIKRVLRKRKPV